MYRSLFAAAMAALASGVMAQQADFVNMTWAPVTVGSLWPVSWSVGNGQPVSLLLTNETWTYIIFGKKHSFQTLQLVCVAKSVAENKNATLGTYDWTVTAPEGFVEGNYALTLVQENVGLEVSPVFAISFSTLPPMSSPTVSASASIASTMSTSVIANATVISAPTVTVVCPVVWFDESCSCHQTTTTPVTMPSPTSTEYVWVDSECGYSKTAIIPTATMPSSNYTAPQMPAGPAATGPAGYPGSGSNVQLSASMIMAIFLGVAAFAL
jgi:hypothetical protein